jgi:trimethylamine--corrinoid protein Co-methyltransferase
MTRLDCARIHDATLRILEEIGVRLEHDAIVDRLLAAGAKPGDGPQVVRFPRSLVQECLALCPRAVTLAARTPPPGPLPMNERGGALDTVLTAESASVFWTNPGLHLWTGSELRDITSADLGRVARLCDNLESVQGVLGMAMADVPPPCRDFTGLRVIAEGTRKHVRVLCFTPTGMEALAAMGRVFPGPWFSIGFTAHGPLRWTHLALDIFLRSSGHGIPATINGEPMAGVTGPVSLAGSVAVGNAEILAGIVVNQVLEPGRPLIYNLGLAHVFDMRRATAVTGGPENALFARASAAMGRFYGIPSSSWVSTEAVYEDEQAALEKMFGFHTHMEEGVSLVWGMGQLESEKTMSLAQLVIDNEMIAYARHYGRGFAVNDDTLALDLIRQVGIAGSYLDTDHTLERFRDHLWQPSLLNRSAREECPAPLHDAARARAESILAADTEAKIGESELAELLRIEGHYRVKILGG